MRIGWLGWSLDVSESWTVTDAPECLTLELSKSGALQVSSLKKRSGAVLPEELLEFADGEDQNWGTASSATCGSFQGLVCSYEHGGSAWRRWFLANESTLVFVTYNGDPGVARLELQAVDVLLKTLRVESET